MVKTLVATPDPEPRQTPIIVLSTSHTCNGNCLRCRMIASTPTYTFTWSA